MNRVRRNRLAKVYEMLSECMEVVEDVKVEEQESYDNLPDNFRDGDRGEEMQNYMELLEETMDYIYDARSVIEQI